MPSSKSMKSSHKRRKINPNRSGESLWKDVTVALGEEQEKDILDQNHYDNEDSDGDGDHKKKKRQRLGKASLDLPVQPGEDIGMMYGLQVLSGDDYTVDPQTRQLQILAAAPADNNTEGDEPTPPAHESTTASTTEQPTKKMTTKKKSTKDIGEKSPSTTEGTATSVTAAATTKTPKPKTKKDTRSATNSEAIGDQEHNDAVVTKQTQSQHTVTEADPSSLDWHKVQQAWSVACGGAVLRESLCRALAKQGFGQPTPIQAATLSASILGRRNLVGASPTGSGKTLAFLLPILQSLLEDDDDDDEADTQNKKIVRALIVTPTRELATQIYKECEVLAPRQCVTLVGGIAPVKQARLLQTIRPSILVGTPGRLWQMISSQEHDHLKDLSHVQFLVLDEADRLTQDHSFPQMVEILERIHLENRGPFESDDESDDESSDSDDEDRMLGLPGIRGESATTMLTPEILRQIQEQRETMPRPGGRKVQERNEKLEHDDSDDEEDLVIEPVEETGEEDFDEVFHIHDGDDENDDNGPPLVHRQTFIYSATLTLPYTSTKATASSQQKKKKPSKEQRKLPLEGGLAEILEKTHAMGETKVVDLSSSSKIETSQSNSNSNTDANGVKLPPGLKLEQIKCTQRHKDSHLYAYLMTTAQGASGPALVFCNSIAAVRRVGTTLQMLGLSVRILHAHMQQRARFKAVESLSKGALDDGSSSSRVVVVCTDVAARGLDIPSVSTVIHYDVARAVDTFVHRAGRTARGMGKVAIGTSLSLIGPSEDKAHGKICERVVSGGGGFGKVHMDGRLLTQAQERVNLACKVVEAESQQKQAASQNAWFLEKAQEADLELDDDLLMDDDEEDQDPKRKEAVKARQQLQHLLAQPMKTQRFGKFLSTNSAALQDEIQSLSAASKKPTPSARSNGKRKRKKQQKGNA